MAFDEEPRSSAMELLDAQVARIASMSPDELDEYVAGIEAEGLVQDQERGQAAADRKEWKRRQN
jgi:hypothetical protein